MKIDLVQIYKKFCIYNNYNHLLPDEKVFNHWVKYRNKKYPKSMYIYTKPIKINNMWNDYNILIKKISHK